MLRRRHALAAVAFGMLLLSACASDDVTQPSPTPSASAPVFESDEEAVEAAKAALDEYFAVSNAIYQAGGNDPQRLADVATGEFLTEAIAGFEEFQESGWAQVGETVHDSTELQQVYRQSDSTVVMVLMCTDFSGRSIVDADGNTLDTSQIPNRSKFEMKLERVDEGSELLVSSVNAWEPNDC
jgi:hypothetical protein